MKKIFKPLSVLICTFLFCSGVSAQESENLFLKFFDSARTKDLTSFKTNTLAEILQGSINNGIITSKGTDLNIKSTIFQLEKLWKPEIAIDRNYIKQTFKRNFEFGLGFKINNDNKINGIGASVKYAIINRRDITVTDFSSMDSSILSVVMSLHNTITAKIQAGLRNPKFIAKDIDSINTKKVFGALTTFSNNNNNENALQQLFIDIGNSILGDMEIDPSLVKTVRYPESITALKKEAQNLEDKIKKRGLLTFGFGSNYINNNWDSLNFKLEYLKGLGWSKDKDKPFDIYAAAFCDLKNDTISKISLGRQVFTAKLGLNKVLLKNKDQKTSFLEILGAAEYNYNIKGLYKEEKNNLIMADFILSIRISPTLFLPIEIKYDIKNANVLGFLKVKWDLPRTSGKS